MYFLLCNTNVELNILNIGPFTDHIDIVLVHPLLTQLDLITQKKGNTVGNLALYSNVNNDK